MCLGSRNYLQTCSSYCLTTNLHSYTLKQARHRNHNNCFAQSEIGKVNFKDANGYRDNQCRRQDYMVFLPKTIWIWRGSALCYFRTLSNWHLTRFVREVLSFSPLISPRTTLRSKRFRMWKQDWNYTYLIYDEILPNETQTISFGHVHNFNHHIAIVAFSIQYSFISISNHNKQVPWKHSIKGS